MKASLYFQFGLVHVELDPESPTVRCRLETLISDQVPNMMERVKSMFGLVGFTASDFEPDLEHVRYILTLSCCQARDEIHAELPSNFADHYPALERVYDVESSPTVSQVRQFEAVVYEALVAFGNVTRIYSKMRYSDGLQATRLCWEAIESEEAQFHVLQNYPAYLFLLNSFKSTMSKFGSRIFREELSVSLVFS